MPDYGRDLIFGAFLTPTNAAPQQVVALTQAAERAGLDLATFQDHPYQPAFLDTWTLLSYVAARTERISLAANVTNLPLRPPAVLARAVASLDLLSGGRVELGLGAGGFWDAIEAMGGRRLTGGQAVEALGEAIDVIRGIWDVDDRSRLHVDGTWYRVDGAKRGPRPAHDISIWLGAYKPRMLRLTGAKADGWLPSLGYLQAPTALSDGNAIIDEAAADAGRDPASVRRLLNIDGRFGSARGGLLDGPPEQWVEQLAVLALEHGISGFVLVGDDPTTLSRFGQEVAPALRELVAAERTGPVDAVDEGPPVPSTATPGPASPQLRPTVDDGVRLSEERLWDETTRPAGPVVDPTRSYTAAEREQGSHLIDVHDHLRAELRQLRGLVDQVTQGAVDPAVARSHIATMTMRQNNWTVGTYCESYCRLVTTHHSLEDSAMFPRLRRADPRLEPVIDRLEEEHQVIHDVLERVDRALVAFVSGPDGVPGLRAAVDLLTDTLLSHLAYEERELVEPLARLGY